MRILKIDKKNQLLELIPDSLDDLWHLEKVIESGDLVSGKSTRKIKPKHAGEKAERIPVFLKLEAASTEFHRFSGKLRVSGAIIEGKPEELVEIKSHHSLEFEPGKKIRVEKKTLKNWQVQRIEKAKKDSGRESILAILLDDEKAYFYEVKEFGPSEKGKIEAQKEGKRYESAGKSAFLSRFCKKCRK